MAEAERVACPVCDHPLAYRERLSDHLKVGHADRQVGYTALEAAPTFQLFISKMGKIFQKVSTVEKCFIQMGESSVATTSSWELMHLHQPIYKLSGGPVVGS